jgi:hypothetical protein
MGICGGEVRLTSATRLGGRYGVRRGVGDARSHQERVETVGEGGEGQAAMPSSTRCARTENGMTTVETIAKDFGSIRDTMKKRATQRFSWCSQRSEGRPAVVAPWRGSVVVLSVAHGKRKMRGWRRVREEEKRGWSARVFRRGIKRGGGGGRVGAVVRTMASRCSLVAVAVCCETRT